MSPARYERQSAHRTLSKPETLHALNIDADVIQQVIVELLERDLPTVALEEAAENGKNFGSGTPCRWQRRRAALASHPVRATVKEPVHTSLR